MIRALASLGLLLPALVLAKDTGHATPSVARIKQAMIAESRASYSGNCPCPEDTTENGAECGRNSAYSRRGGRSPLCYEKNITEPMMQAWLARQRTTLVPAATQITAPEAPQ
ncbi:hypothetical protein [Sphaerotilus natans]|uniref:hypothetical protein n=1 Tax=Sphaerotilus natans TaxID=34103 RepID=UPI00406C9949